MPVLKDDKHVPPLVGPHLLAALEPPTILDP